ncbi:MAG: NAD(P)H-dependent oxidoreductase subunit E [Candidatus Riflebacteria bacterium]|nr:NAD(P)H-dependent oxidoreductase subunit E [Candidatus Riflebacteria bacterium]
MADPFDVVKGIIDRHDHDRSRLIQAMYEIQDTLGYLSDPILSMLAEGFRMAKSEVFGIASFYPHFHLKARARYTIRCCTSVVCEICGGAGLREAIRRHLRIRDGETTRDGLFLFRPVACLGACDQAPAIKINDTVFGGMTRERIPDLLQKVARNGLEGESA